MISIVAIALGGILLGGVWADLLPEYLDISVFFIGIAMIWVAIVVLAIVVILTLIRMVYKKKISLPNENK